MYLSKRVFSLIFIFILLSCSNDEGPEFEVVPPRDFSEVHAEDAAALIEYLETHFYNYEDFDNPPAGFDFKIVLDTIAGDNATKTPLIDQVSSEARSVQSGEFFLEEDTTLDHTFYYLNARPGGGPSPSVADSTFVRYKGSLLTGESFDASEVFGVWFDLAQLQGPQQGARGFSEAMPYFESGTDFVENGDGTVTVVGYGVGLMFLPSGLGFFNVPQGTVPAYSPLIFEVDLFAVNPTDHDNDGIPSIQEDLDGDGYLYNDNTDEAAEESTGQLIRFSNFLDPDDDQDGTPTREEIELDDEGNLISTPDSDGDGIPDYLDPDTN
jgi:hypothetical protein